MKGKRLIKQGTGAQHAAKSRRRLTLKQQKFAVSLVGAAKGNQALAAKMAGYKGSPQQLAVQGSVNMRNASVQDRIAHILDAAGCTDALAAQRLREGIDATKGRVFLSESALLYAEPEVDFKERRQYLELYMDWRSKADKGAQSRLQGNAESLTPAEAIEEAQELLLLLLDCDGITQFMAKLEERLQELATGADGPLPVGARDVQSTAPAGGTPTLSE